MENKGNKSGNIYQKLKGAGAWQSKDSAGPMIKGVGIKSPLNMKKPPSEPNPPKPTPIDKKSYPKPEKQSPVKMDKKVKESAAKLYKPSPAKLETAKKKVVKVKDVPKKIAEGAKKGVKDAVKGGKKFIKKLGNITISDPEKKAKRKAAKQAMKEEAIANKKEIKGKGEKAGGPAKMKKSAMKMKKESAMKMGKKSPMKLTVAKKIEAGKKKKADKDKQTVGKPKQTPPSKPFGKKKPLKKAPLKMKKSAMKMNEGFDKLPADVQAKIKKNKK